MLLYYYIELLMKSPVAFVVFVGAFACSLLTALILHEVSHGLVALLRGDRTALVLGRLTLNPRAHWDPVGTTMMFILGFGWAKPVPVNPYNLSNPVRDMALVALAGPSMNFLIAILAGLPIRLGMVPLIHPFTSLGYMSLGWENLVGLFLGTVMLLNIIIGVFNLVPIPPLDGSKIVPLFLPRVLRSGYEKFSHYGMFILILLIMLPWFGLPGIGSIIGPIISNLVPIFSGVNTVVF